MLCNRFMIYSLLFLDFFYPSLLLPFVSVSIDNKGYASFNSVNEYSYCIVFCLFQQFYLL